MIIIILQQKVVASFHLNQQLDYKATNYSASFWSHDVFSWSRDIFLPMIGLFQSMPTEG